MSITALADGDIDRDSPLKQLVMQALRARDAENWATATGSGIDPNVQAFVSKLLSHRHDGAAGHGDQINDLGIASDAVNDGGMLASSAVGSSELASGTVNTNNLATGAVTTAKMHNTMGYPVTGGPQNFDTAGPAAGDDRDFQGDTMKLGNPKGALGVICNAKPGATNSRVDWWVLKMDNSDIYFGLRTAGLGASGQWDVDCYIM